MLDLLIKDGDVVDGSGRPRRHADVGVEGGRVVAIGDVDGPARRTLDAEGRVVAPGFVDIHTHLDVQGFWDPTLSPSPLHGVTTVVGGNCGFTVAPLAEREAEYLMRMLARVEGMPLEVLERHVPWDWRSTAEYLARLDGRLAVNAGFMVGHSAVRRVVMGEAGSERAATDDELVAMQQLLRDGLDAGALGFSTSWADSHKDGDGNPVPSRHATADELVALSAVCRDAPGTSLEFLAQNFGPFEEPIVDVMARMSSAAQRMLNWNVLFPMRANLDECLQRLSASDVAAARGGKVVGLVMPVRERVRINFWSGFTLDMLPGWAHTMTAPRDEKLRALSDPGQRRRLAELAAQPSTVRHMANWGDWVIVDTFAPENERYRERIVGDIAAEQGKDPFDALLDIVCADRLRTTFTFNRDPLDPAEWDARVRIMRDDRALIGGSDAGAHIGESAQFNYPTLLLAEAVRCHQVLSLEEVVALVTDRPARIYGLRDRGRLVEGACADIVVFDEATVASNPVTMCFDLPEGAARLTGGAAGIDHVLVNGAEIVDHGVFTDERPGRILRSGTDTVTAPLG
jgi:N-acyl-D-aspartate/D-glutamate deacylase